MTPEQVTAMVNALGYPVCVSIAMFCIIIVIGRWYHEANQRMLQLATKNAEESAKLAKASQETIERNSAVMSSNTLELRTNTQSNRSLNDTLEKLVEAQAALCKHPGR